MDAIFEEELKYINGELEAYEASSPDVISLAMLAAPARKIEPELLRALRIELAGCFPAHRKPHVGTEFALWFSTLVENRGSDSISFLPAVSEYLRRRLRDEYPEQLENIRRIILKCHEAVPPVIAWEEDLIYHSLSAKTDPEFRARVGEKILEAAKAVQSGESEGLDEWINRMYVRIPRKLSENDDFKKLVAVSQQQIIRKTELTDASRNLSTTGDTLLKIKRDGGKLEIGKSIRNADFQIGVPNLSPVKITVRGSRDEVYIVPDGETIRIEFDADEPAPALQTIDGRIYQIPVEEDAVSRLIHEAEINQSTELNLSSEKTGKKLTSKELIELIPKIRRNGNLLKLDLSFNELDDELNSISFFEELKNLTDLNLSGNRIKDASFLVRLFSLDSVNLSNNLLTGIAFLDRLNALRELDLSGNAIEDFSPLEKTESLQALDLSFTGIRDASLLGALRQLTSLKLVSNQLADASFVRDLTRLKELDLSGNPELNLPEELTRRGMIDRQRIDEIIDYYQQLETQGQDHLREAKVLIIGEPHTGKTDLFRRLLNPDYFLPDVVPYSEQQSPAGIKIETIEFPDRDSTFRAHLWDFSGRKIYQALHQYFFTESSLYILLTDDTTEPGALTQWLEIIAVRGSGSPVLVVFNEKFSNVKNYDLEIQRREFGELIHSIEERSVDLGNDGDDRFIELVGLLKNRLTNLKHVRQPVPKSWMRVREQLLYIRESIIGIDQYNGICRENGVENINQGESVFKFLHDSGIVFDYQNKAALRSPLILKPSWLTEALYRILGDSRIVNNGGKFTAGQAFDLWWEYAADEKLVLLNLLLRENFGIAYKLEGAETYVVPMLLPETAPEFGFDETGALRVDFEYRFKPKGILSRLIVRLHESIVFDEQTSAQIVWRNGVLLNRDGATARIVESDESRKITAAVSGRDAAKVSEFINLIRNEIKLIHREWFEDRLQFEEKIEGAFIKEQPADTGEMTISEKQAIVDEVSSKMNGAQRETMEKLADEMLFRILNSEEPGSDDDEWSGFENVKEGIWEAKIKFALQFIPVKLSKNIAPDEFVARFRERLYGEGSTNQYGEAPGGSLEEESFEE